MSGLPDCVLDCPTVEVIREELYDRNRAVQAARMDRERAVASLARSEERSEAEIRALRRDIEAIARALCIPVDGPSGRTPLTERLVTDIERIGRERRKARDEVDRLRMAQDAGVRLVESLLAHCEADENGESDNDLMALDLAALWDVFAPGTRACA